jgi:hypothetical protein
MCLQIPSFWRMDVMYNSLCRIRKWKNFFVVELNGAQANLHIFMIPSTLIFLHGN